MGNPYSNLPPRSFWRKAVSGIAPFDLDPTGDVPFSIEPTDRVATAGSCFAQHIARSLAKGGYNYYVVEETPDDMPPDEASRKNYGVFSARYGNVYTVRQLLQLFKRAYGEFKPSIQVWPRPDGRFVDPFRPQIDPDGFADEVAIAENMAKHLQAVRRMFETLDIFVFTLGLTEAWQAVDDGATVPIAPGVSGGIWDESTYRFVNYTVETVSADLLEFIDRLRQVNPRSRIILTVSPVPLVATYERQHVLTSTVYSKSVLRVAAEKASRERPNVVYFPSFEIITNASTSSRYFEPDLRSITERGVAHVMRVFLRNFTGKPAALQKTEEGGIRHSFGKEFLKNQAVVCDEEALDSNT